MPATPAVPPKQDVLNNPNERQQQIIGEVPSEYKDPQKALDSSTTKESQYTFDLSDTPLNEFKKKEENDELSNDISAENRSKAAEASAGADNEEDNEYEQDM